MENSQISDNNCERKGPFHEGKAGMPEFLATHLTAVAQDHQDGVFSAETDVVEKSAAGCHNRWAEFVRAHVVEFRS